MNSELLKTIMIGAVSGVVAAILVVLIGKALNIRVLKGKRMGLNLARNLKCPSCSSALPTFRKPTNLQQALWGGWTCKKCGSEFDKWLNLIEQKK